MARVSRKAGRQESAPQTPGVYRTAIYLRLSVEDNGKKDPDSIENQEALLREYIANRNYLRLAGTYTDNGYTGTDFDRPAFHQMLEDVRAGKIDCILVKDLSRLGRDYVETGHLLEKVFPFLGVRFIAVNDNYDSASLSSSEELGASLKNLINDVYAKDISRKSSTALKAKRQRGEYTGSYAPYGYLKDPADKNHLIPDPETADTVREIFALRAEGTGIGSLTRILNERDIPSPGRLRFERGIITNNNKKGKDLPWNRHVLSDLLKNVVYIGHLAQGRSSSSLYQGIPYHWVDEAEWDVAENTHEPIISMELWNRVQAVNAQSRKDSKDCYGKYHYLAKRENPYGELLRCADCGRVIKQVHSYSKSGKKVYFNYKCPNNIELGDAACPKKSIRADDLDVAVLTLMHRQMELFLDSQTVLKECLADIKKKAPTANAENRAREIRQAIDKRTKQSTGLYGDYKDGVLSKEEYLYAKNTYQDEVERLRQELREMEEVRRSAGKIADGIQNWSRLVRKYAKTKKVSGEMVRAMIKSITLYADNSISIEFLYMDEFEKIQETCARLRGEVA